MNLKSSDSVFWLKRLSTMPVRFQSIPAYIVKVTPQRVAISVKTSDGKTYLKHVKAEHLEKR